MQNDSAVMSLVASRPAPVCRACRHGQARDGARFWLVWLLISALCIYAASGSVLRMMGPKHWHAGAVSAVQPARSADLATLLFGRIVQVLADAQALADAAHARAHVAGAAPHHHSHSGLLRHWHSQHDDSVRVLDASDAVDPELADLKAAAAMGGATLLLALGPDMAWRPTMSGNGAWPASHPAAWLSADLSPPAEPPIA